MRNYMKKILYSIPVFIFALTVAGGTGCAGKKDYSGMTSHMNVVFSQPGMLPETGHDSNIEDRIATVIDSARLTLDISIYELSVATIYEAIIRAHERGVKVRFVGDIDNIEVYEGYQALKEAQVPMTLGNKTKIMHNKIVIVDKYNLIMGSANFTDSGFNLNWENVLFIQSYDLAAYYTNEMNNMFELGQFGLDKDASTFDATVEGYTDPVRNPAFNENICRIGDVDSSGNFIINDNYVVVEAFFPPYLDGLLNRQGTSSLGWSMPAGYSDIPTLETDFSSNDTPYHNDHYTDDDGMLTANDRIIDVINNATTSIRVAMFAFTSNDIGNAIIHAKHQRPDLEIYLIMDKSWHFGVNSETETGNEYAMHQWFLDYGIDARYDGNENFSPDNPIHGGKCHNKFAIIDGETDNGVVITGSFNFSSSAATDGNDENCLIIYNKNIARAYQEEFDRNFEYAKSPTRTGQGDYVSGALGHQIMINEIMWAGSKSNGGEENSLDAFIELKNNQSFQVNISGWQIKGVTDPSADIISFIVPEDTWIEAGGHYVVYYSLLSEAYTYEANANQYINMRIHSTANDYVYFELKDPYQIIVDIAGNADADRKRSVTIPGVSATPIQITNYSPRGTGLGSDYAPFEGDDGTIFKSMYRIGINGASSVSWATTEEAVNISDNYSSSTYATPGADDSNQ